MKLRLRCALMIALAAFLVSNFSCAHDQELTSIDVVPAKQAFGDSTIPVFADAGLSVQMRALGHYIHPPVTKDITNQVTWAVNDTQMFAMSSSGLLTATGNICGGSIVSATLNTGHDSTGRSSSGAVVTGQSEADVICFTGTGGGGSGALLTVQFSGGGAGIVLSTPAGINCATTCSANFASGTAINVTATPNSGSTFGSWANCDAISGQTCIINSLGSNRTVTITFN